MSRVQQEAFRLWVGALEGPAREMTAIHASLAFNAGWDAAVEAMRTVLVEKDDSLYTLRWVPAVSSSGYAWVAQHKEDEEKCYTCTSRKASTARQEAADWFNVPTENIIVSHVDEEDE